MFKHPFLPPGYEYKKDGSDIDIHKSPPDEDTPARSLVAWVSHEYAEPGYERGKLYAIQRSIGSMSHFFVQEVNTQQEGLDLLAARICMGILEPGD
ncbi:MAG: hypothetical protein IPH85_11935 [Ignavibacteria bacterium]|jgi:hypothetical protein|nr:hypothetical protein [Ignavibacteria bacterium]